MNFAKRIILFIHLIVVFSMAFSQTLKQYSCGTMLERIDSIQNKNLSKISIKELAINSLYNEEVYGLYLKNNLGTVLSATFQKKDDRIIIMDYGYREPFWDSILLYVAEYSVKMDTNCHFIKDGPEHIYGRNGDLNQKHIYFDGKVIFRYEVARDSSVMYIFDSIGYYKAYDFRKIISVEGYKKRSIPIDQWRYYSNGKLKIQGNYSKLNQNEIKYRSDTIFYPNHFSIRAMPVLAKSGNWIVFDTNGRKLVRIKFSKIGRLKKIVLKDQQEYSSLTQINSLLLWIERLEEEIIY